MIIFKRYLPMVLASGLCILSLSTRADQPRVVDATTDHSIKQLYHRLNHKLKSDGCSRVEVFSAQFLGAPYLLGALGEGGEGFYDQSPLYRLDAFDCVTYMDTVLALVFSHDVDQFKQCINQIRYRDGKPEYVLRNHFTSLDWNKNNQRKKFIKDITASFHNEARQPVSKEAVAIINKPAWYDHRTMDNLHLGSMSLTEKTKRLSLLKQAGKQLSISTSIIPYIPLSVLFDASGTANNYVFNQIPNGAIIEIVRPNWDLTKTIGTHLHVSHLGFAIWKNNTLMFRNASSTHQSVIDVDLIEYLRDAQKSPTIKGINVQIVLPQANRLNKIGC